MATAQRYKRRLVSTPVTTAVTTAAYFWDMATATHGLRQTSTHPEAKERVRLDVLLLAASNDLQGGV